MNKQINLIDLINEENNNLNQSNTSEFEENNISELHIHKILYILFGKFYKEFSKNLFNHPNFEAWKFGPVEIDFRRSWKSKTWKEIQKFNICLNPKELMFIKKLLKKLLCYSPWTLVEITHTSDAWIYNYHGKEGNHQKISEQDIWENF